MSYLTPSQCGHYLKYPVMSVKIFAVHFSGMFSAPLDSLGSAGRGLLSHLICLFSNMETDKHQLPFSVLVSPSLKNSRNVLKECALGKIQALSPPQGVWPAQPTAESPECCPGEEWPQDRVTHCLSASRRPNGVSSFMGSQGRSQRAEMVRKAFRRRRVVIILKW